MLQSHPLICKQLFPIVVAKANIETVLRPMKHNRGLLSTVKIKIIAVYINTGMLRHI